MERENTLPDNSGEEIMGSMRSLDQWGGEIGSKESMRRGNKLHEIGEDGE